MHRWHPLQALEGREVGGYRVHLARLEPTPKSGWRRFSLTLLNEGQELPCVTGIYSAGGRGVAPWVEILRYAPPPALADDPALFGLLRELIPPGGHLMVGVESPVLRESYLALIKGTPPAATPLGALLVRAGFPRVRFFDLPEGGWEGEQKLWAERPPDAATESAWRTQTVQELERFLDAPPAAEAARRCLPIAQAIREHLGR